MINGYSLLADTHRKAGQEKQARIFDFLATCDREDIYTLFDSSAFNEIAKGYLRLTMSQLTEQGAIDEAQGEAIRDLFAMQFDNITAREVIEG